MITVENKFVKEWTQGGKIIDAVWNANTDALFVIVAHPEGEYQLLRFFKIGSCVNVSIDINDMSASDFIKELFQKLLIHL